MRHGRGAHGLFRGCLRHWAGDLSRVDSANFLFLIRLVFIRFLLDFLDVLLVHFVDSLVTLKALPALELAMLK